MLVPEHPSPGAAALRTRYAVGIVAGLMAGVAAIVGINAGPDDGADPPAGVAVQRSPAWPPDQPAPASPTATVGVGQWAVPVRAPGQPLRIMPLGDSITAGVGSRTRGSYRTDLRARLTRAGLPVDFVGSQRSGAGPDVDHEGHGGWTIDRLTAGMDAWLREYRPDVVLLHAGTNDVTSGDSAGRVAAELSALVDQIRAARPFTYVFVCTIIGSRVPAELAVGRRYNALVPGIVAGRGPMVRLVDQSMVTGTDLRDLRHPDDVGYAKMSLAFYRALERVFNDSGAPWPTGSHRRRR